MATRIFCLAFLSALASQGSFVRASRAESLPEGIPLPIDPERDDTLWGAGDYDPFADDQADLFGDYTMAR